MTLSVPAFDLPAYVGVADVDQYSLLTQKMAQIGASSGRSAKWFEQRCHDFQKLVGTESQIEQFVVNRKDVHVVLHLWKTDARWTEWHPLTIQSVRFLRGLFGKFKSAQVGDLLHVYFQYFDQLPQYVSIGGFISTSINEIERTRLLANQRKIVDHRETIFHPDAPKLVGKDALGIGPSFDAYVEVLGLKSATGRFLQACKNAYYVENVRALKIGASHPILDELKKPAVKESRYDESFNLGQMIAKVMIGRCAGLPDGMPAAWVSYVTDALGDPRRPKKSTAYQKWWATMDRDDENLMRRWLAGADLRLFLKILKDSSSDKDLQRMYPARRKFLEGLLEHHDIVDARLFLGGNARELIRREYGAESLAAHGKLTDAHKTVVYMNLDDKLHFFEGTHNYKARGGGVLPEGHRTLSRSATTFTYNELTTTLESDLKVAGLAAEPQLESFSRTHHPPIGWQNELIWEFEYYGIDVDPESVLTPTDYLKYRKTYGV